MAKIVGILGQAGAGKDTAADALVKELGFVKLSLADPLKRFCREVFGFSKDALWGSSEMRNAHSSLWDGLTPRKALQTLGTEWGRAMHPDTWIRHGIRTAQQILTGFHYSPVDGLAYPSGLPTPSGVVIPDVRFRNEVEAVKAAGGLVVRIVRPGSAGAVGGVAGHTSETEQLGIPAELFDATIVNDSSLENFRAEVVHTVRSLLASR